MKKNFTNPEIKISLFNQERVRTDGQFANPAATADPMTGSSLDTNYTKALKWLQEDKGVTAATNIISFKE